MASPEEIFEHAKELPPSARNEYLKEACKDNDELLRRVSSLLRDAASADAFFESSARPLPMEPPPVPVHEGAGSTVDRYRVLRRLGEGGFGTVFLAEQREPVRRRVALKIIKEGMGSKEVLERFKAERQALAMMDHPNIAGVLDGGTTASGRPYFVMELVKGQPITRYCDEKRLNTRARIELFGDVCAAVQHAHQKGVIHRDLKPSNILVAEVDGTPVIKVIDFGVAKALQQPLTDGTLFTRAEQLVGTPLYMSPEQADIGEVDIDTRSDIYSLGVLLYELLTGKPPIEPTDLLAAGFDEMRRLIREKTPPKPSTRIESLTEPEMTTTAEHRQIPPSRLRNALKGDLDWIVMKALEKERSRRYETANALKADLGRFLHSEPVSAGPPSILYRGGKLIRRYRWQAAAVVTILLLLLSGILASTSLAVKASRSATAAKQSSRLAEAKAVEALEARAIAETEEKRAQESKKAADALAAENWRMAYLGKMRIANQAWNLNMADKLKELLREAAPKPQQADRRGLAWRYLAGWLESDRDSLVIERAVTCADATPDGRFLAYGTKDGSVTITRYPERITTKVFRGEWDAPLCIDAGNGIEGVFITRGGSLVSFNKSRYHIHSQFLANATDSVQAIYLTMDSSVALLLTKQGSIQLIDLETAETHLEKKLGYEITASEISPDRTTLVVGTSEPRTKIFSLEQGLVLDSTAEPEPAIQLVCEASMSEDSQNPPNAFSFSPTGDLLFRTLPYGEVECTRTGEVKPFWSSNDFTRLGTIRLERSPDDFAISVLKSAFLGDESKVAVTNGRTIDIWRVGQEGKEIKISGPDELVDWWSVSMGFLETPGGKGVYMLGKSGVLVEMGLERRLNRAVLRSPAGGRLGRPTVSRDSRFIAAPGRGAEQGGRGLCIWDSATGELIEHLFPDLPVSTASFSPHQDLLFVAIPGWREFAEIESGTWGTVRGLDLRQVAKPSWPERKVAVSIAFDESNPNRIAVSHDDGSIDLIEVSSRETLTSFDWFERSSWAGFSPDGRYLFAHTFWDPPILWDLIEGRNVYEGRGHRGPCSQAFSPDGKTIANGGHGSWLIMEDPNSGTFDSWLGHGQHVSGIEFSADGRSVLTISCRGELFFWDRELGELLVRLDHHIISEDSNLGAAMKMSPDGSFVVTVGPDGALRVWRFPSIDELETVVTERSRRELQDFYSPEVGSVRHLGQANDLVGAEEAARRLLPILVAELGDENHVTLVLKRELAIVLSRKGDSEEASQLFREILEVRRKYSHPDNADARWDAYSFAEHCMRYEDFDSAEKVLRRLYESMKKAPESHLLQQATAFQFARCLSENGKLEESMEVYDDLLLYLTAHHEGMHEEIHRLHRNRAEVFIRLRDFDKAAGDVNHLLEHGQPGQGVKILRRLIAEAYKQDPENGTRIVDSYLEKLVEFVESVDEESNQTRELLDAVRGFGELLHQIGQANDAERLLRVLYRRESVLDPGGPPVLHVTRTLAFLALKAGRLDESEELFRERYEGWLALGGHESYETRWAALDLAGRLRSLKRLEEAESLLALVQPIQLNTPEPEWLTTGIMRLYGVTLKEAGKSLKSVETFDWLIEWLEDRERPNEKWICDAMFQRGHAQANLEDLNACERTASELLTREDWGRAGELLGRLQHEFRKRGEQISASSVACRRGLALARLGRTDEALRAVSDAIDELESLTPGAEDAERHQQALKEAKELRSEIELLLDDFGDSPDGAGGE